MNFAEGTNRLVIPVPDGAGFAQVVITKSEHPTLRATAYVAKLGDHHAMRSVTEALMMDETLDAEDIIIRELVHGVLEEKKMREAPPRRTPFTVSDFLIVDDKPAYADTERKEAAWQL